MELYKDVVVTYDGQRRIVVKGEGIKIVLLIDMIELAAVYSGSEGKGKIIVTTE